MHQYQALVKANGMMVQTVIFAENVVAAIKLLQAIYGASNVASQPMQIK
jgi:hypothetical protein